MDRMSLTNSKVLITGGNGYLGNFLSQKLTEKGADVSILDVKGSGRNTYHVDITNKSSVREAVQEIDPDIVFHLAASLNRKRDFTIHDEVMAINYGGTLNLLHALNDIDYQNLIFASTGEIYGNGGTPFHEEQPGDPVSPYSLSKFCAEYLLKTYSKISSKPYTILRVFNFFGRKMPDQFFIPQLVHALRTGSAFKMTEGEQARDFLHIEDVVQAFLLSAQNEEALNQTLNVCSGRSTTLKELALLMREAAKSQCKIEFGALRYRENEIWDMVGSNQRIKEVLGFNPKYSLTSAIEDVLKEIR